MEDLLNMIGNVGFPIAVSVYLLIRVETKLTDLSTAIGELREAIITLPRPGPCQTLTPFQSPQIPHQGNGKAPPTDYV